MVRECGLYYVLDTTFLVPYLGLLETCVLSSELCPPLGSTPSQSLTPQAIGWPLCMEGCSGLHAMLCLVAQSCPTLCDPVDCSPPGSSVHLILQAGILEWVAMPSPGDHPNPGMEARSPPLQVDSLPSEPPENPW